MVDMHVGRAKVPDPDDFEKQFPMSVFEAIRTRRSIRRFIEDKEVPEAMWKKLIDVCRWAPSACNRQGWRFVVMKDKSQVDRLAEAGSVYYLKRLPLAMLMVYDKRTDNVKYHDHLQSACAGIMNMFLAAHAMGLGMVWCDNLPAKSDIRKIFNIPWHYDIIALLGFGFYDKNNMPPPLPRKKSVDELFSFDRWSLVEPVPNRLDIKLRLKTFFRWCYHATPIWLKKYLHPFAKKFEKIFDPKDMKTDVKEMK
ncbi:MAG TPA: nitroreductase family protein [Candidatus Nanoarchaeia archaeon]|nr:nitroreductase family protein [Candidatus Nanoarchaeia archaeon]